MMNGCTSKLCSNVSSLKAGSCAITCKSAEPLLLLLTSCTHASLICFCYDEVPTKQEASWGAHLRWLRRAAPACRPSLLPARPPAAAASCLPVPPPCSPPCRQLATLSKIGLEVDLGGAHSSPNLLQREASSDCLHACSRCSFVSASPASWASSLQAALIAQPATMPACGPMTVLSCSCTPAISASRKASRRSSILSASPASLLASLPPCSQVQVSAPQVKCSHEDIWQRSAAASMSAISASCVASRRCSTLSASPASSLASLQVQAAFTAQASCSARVWAN